ncbi:hypothetical protein LPJ75_000923 [Coemansia sp. RSA 2598]|nr:hypothetical protein LPJ75_000923 [Coemansia sp. RSA 2598]
MSSSVTVVYGGGKTVNVKTTPTTTLQTVLSNVCEKVGSNGAPNAETHTLVYNGKPIDLSLTIRFANLPQGAKLKLTSRSGAARSATGGSQLARSAAGAAGSSGAATPTGAGLKQSGLRETPVKVALQIVGSGRIIKEYLPSTSLWDIVALTEQGAGGALNLTNRYRVVEAGSLSPIERGLGFLSNALGRISGGSGSNSEAEDSAGTPKRIYQQPVLVVLNKEVSSLHEMQSTTLKSLGFGGGSSVMIRLSFKDSAEVPAARPMAQTAVSAPVTPVAADRSPAVASAPASEKLGPVDRRGVGKTALGIAMPAENSDGCSAESSNKSVGGGDSAQTLDERLFAARQVQVFAPPSSSSTSSSLGSRIVLPESFYSDDSSDLKLLISVQRERQAESERGFRSRIKQEKEEQKKHEQLKQKYPKTTVRFRFPDQAQVQATFLSIDTVDELFQFVREILVIPQTLQTLTIQPPVTDLGKMLSTTLFDAKLTPAAVVHVKLQAGMVDKVATSSLVKEHVWQKVQNTESLMLASDEDGSRGVGHKDSGAVEGGAAGESGRPQGAGTGSRTGSGSQTAARAGPAPAPAPSANADGPRMPKWFLAGQRRT